MLNRLILALAVLWSSHGLAGEHVGPKKDWHYDIGYFHYIGGPSQAWSETIDGVESFQFVQTNTTASYTELYDASRQIYVRLFDDRMTLKRPEDDSFSFFEAGHWDDRRFYVYKLPDGSTAYFLLQPSEVWRWVRPNQANVYLRETLRNDEQVQLYNAREDYTLSLLDGQLWFKASGGAWTKLADAAWSL